MKKVIIVGASSGIGAEMARVFSEKGYAVGIAARRLEMLEELKSGMAGEVFIKRMDVADDEKSIVALNELIGEMGGMNVLVICAGITERNEGKLDWGAEKAQMNINAIGFAALAVVGFNYFLDRGEGTLVGISSVAMLRGNRFLPAYAASKACMSIYLEGLRLRASKLGSRMKVVDIRPGFVDTPMARKDNLAFTVADLGRSAREMVRSIEKGKRVAYVPAFWSGFALLFRHIPNFIYEKI